MWRWEMWWQFRDPHTKLPVTSRWSTAGLPEHKAFNLLKKTRLVVLIRPLYICISHHGFRPWLYLWLQCPQQECPSGFFHHLHLKQTSVQLGIGTHIYCQCLQWSPKRKAAALCKIHVEKAKVLQERWQKSRSLMYTHSYLIFNIFNTQADPSLPPN